MESEFERLTNSNNLWDSHGKFIDCAAMEYFEMYRFDVSGAEGREGHAFTGRVVNGSNDLRPGLGLGDSVKMVQAGDDGHSGGGEKSASTANDQGAKPSQQQGKNGQKPASDGSAGSEPTETLDDNSPMPLEQPMSSCGTPSESESSHDGQIPSHRIKQKAVSDSKDEGLESLKASDIRAPYAKLDDEFERRQARRDLEDELDAYVDPATKVDGHEVGSRESSPESCADGSTRQTYRLLAYDPATMDMKTAETTSSTPPAKIMNLEEATLGLNAPAIFLPYVDDMRRDGYEIVSGGGDVLLFRKVGEAAKMPDSEQSTGSDGKSKGGQETEYTGGRNRSGGYNEAEPHHAGTRHGRHTFLTIFTLASAFIISGCYFNGMRWEVEDMCVPSFNAESERRRTS